MTSYDISKAFDSVQHFTIRASCERLNLPEEFIAYVLASLDGAESHVRCKDGLTSPFRIGSSVRQGDPLAALVFILVMDGLHQGLEHNPLGKTAAGYTMGGNGPTIHSAGYSDDTATTADSWAAAEEKHDWVREFFVAHHLRFNAGKTYCVVGTGTGVSCPASQKDCTKTTSTPDDRATKRRKVSSDPSPGRTQYATTNASDPRPVPTTETRRLPGIREEQIHDPLHGLPAPAELLDHPPPWDPHSSDKHDIETRDPSFAFRYLGYYIRLDLQCP